jgi:hypothetical protein
MHFLIETNGKISSLNFMQQVGRNQLSIYWTSMNLFTDTISHMRMSGLSSSGVHGRELLLSGVDLFPLGASAL